MSKVKKKRDKAKALAKRAHSRNHRRKQEYAGLASSTGKKVTSGEQGNGKTKAGKKGRFSGMGLTKAQKKRLATGRPTEGRSSTYGSSSRRSW